MKKIPEIKIIQVMVSSGVPKFVEFFSPVEKKDIIMNADRFCSSFGYTMEELEAMVDGTEYEEVTG